MLTIISRWETTQLTPETEWNMWRQLKGAYAVDRFVFVPILPAMDGYPLEQYATMEAALASTTDQRVFLEVSGTKGMGDLPLGDMVLICGDTSTDNLAHTAAGEIYRIASDGLVTQNHLYGVNAAGIALAIRYGQ